MDDKPTDQTGMEPREIGGEPYWATASTDEIAQECQNRVRNYFLFLMQSGKLDLYRKAYRMYYNPALCGAQVNFMGEQGELVQISVNEARMLIKHIHTMTCSKKPSFQCRSSNTDHKSQAQCILGQGLVDYYLREKKLDFFLKMATEYALLFAEGFLSAVWNATSGEEYGVDPETGAVIYEGDIEYDVGGPLDVARDFTVQSPQNPLWLTWIKWQNKYDLAAKYPEYAEQIKALNDQSDLFDGIDTFRQSRRMMFGAFDTDQIPVFYFYHRTCSALPKGRMVQYLDDDLVLFDGAMPYKDVPIYRISAAEWLGTPFGYTVFFDMMPVQEMSDSLDSTICSNQNAFGVQNIWTKKGDNVEPSQLAGGLRLLQSDEKPEALQLTSTAPEIFNYRQALTQYKQSLSGINSVVTGDPGRDMSGSAMALLAAQAIQFNGDLQQSYASLLEDVGTATLDRLRVFAQVPRVAAIVGKSNRQYMKEFVGDDIATVNRVLVDMGNPIMNTTAGKINMADQLLKSGRINTAEQYIMVYTTGQLEPLYENEQSALMLIRAENELISEGQVPTVLITDNPVLHCKEHETVANSPEARSNPQIMQAYTQHIQDHFNKWKGYPDPTTGQWVPGIDPVLANLLGIPPPPPPPQMGPPQPLQPVPQPTNQNPHQKPGMKPPAGPVAFPGTRAMNPNNPAEQKASEVNMPNLPHLPPGAPPQAQEAAQGASLAQ